MTQYSDEMKFVLFPADQRGNDRAPVFKGHVTIDGKKYSLSAWQRAKGVLSGSVEEWKEKSQSQSSSSPREQTVNQQTGGFDSDLDDDLPF